MSEQEHAHALEFRFFYFTSHYDAAVAFYRDGLDLPIFRSWDRGPADRGTIFRAPNGGGMIEIEFGEDSPPSRAGFYIQVDDVDAWYKKAAQRGLNITGALEVTSYRHRNFWLTDPAGFRIGMFEYAGD